MHQQLPLLLALLTSIVLIEMLATKLRVAYPVLLVIAGLLVSFIPGLPRVQIDPNMIFFIFLPPLLSDAAWNVSFKEMKKWWRMIGSFAFLVVLFSAFAVALLANHLIPGFTLALGFLLGSIVSPPDAVSAGAIMKFVKIPRSTSAILEGESLLNDASSLIIFRFALVAVGTGQLIFHEALRDFSWMIFGGVGIGLLFGWLFVKAHKYLPTDAPSDIVFTLLEPYFLYWIAEQVHGSGVLAVVSGGLFLANRRFSFLSSSSRVRGHSFWEALIFILNGVVFMLIGLELPEVVAGIRADGTPLSEAIYYGVLVTAVLIITRMISSYAAMIATRIFRPAIAVNIISNNRRRALTMPLLMGWTGMRGVVSLAAALSIPTTLNGQPFPHRNLILFVTFVVILLTLLCQGLTLPYFIKRSNINSHFAGEPDGALKVKVKRLMVEETVRLLKDKQEQGLLADHKLQRMIEQWEHKIKQPETMGLSETSKHNYLALLEDQRKFLLEINKDPEFPDEIIRWQIFQIDLEEERIKLL